MNIERSRVGEAASRTGLRLLGSDPADQRKTPGWVHGWTAEAAPPEPETFVQPANGNATSSTESNDVILTLMRIPVLHPPAQALLRDRCRAARKSRARHSEQ